MNPVKRLLGIPQLEQALKVAERWMDRAVENQKTAEQWKEEAERLHHKVEVERLRYARNTRDLIENFLVILDMPEDADEVRPRLIDALQDLSDEVARREEKIVL